jgi:integrase
MEGLRGNVRQVKKNPPLWQVYFGGNHDRFFTQRDSNGNLLRSKEQALNMLMSINRKNYKPLPTVDHTYDFGKLALKWVEKSTCEIEWKEKRQRIVDNLFIPYFGARTDIRAIGDKVFNFQSHLKGRGLSQKTVNNYLLELKCFFNSQKKIIPPDKFPEFPKIKKVQPKLQKRLTPQEQDEVFKFIPEHHLPIFMFLKFTACRPNEAGGLLKENVNLKKREFYFVTALGKGKRIKDTKTREAPTPFELIDPLFKVIRPLMDKPG